MKSVSCLMITLDRLKCFERSFAAFCSQDYPNRELIVVCDGPADIQRSILNTVSMAGGENVSVCFVPRARLGSLRNRSLDMASGELICQWDDDDLNHPARLSAQVQAMEELGVTACFLSDHLQLFEDTQIAHLWDWALKPGQFSHPGTLLASKAAVPRYDPCLSTREDVEVQRALFDSGAPVGLVSGLGALHIYSFHGSNTFARSHHERLNSLCAANASAVAALEPWIQSCLDEHQLTGPIKVCDDLDQKVFSWSRSPDKLDANPAPAPLVKGFSVRKVPNWRPENPSPVPSSDQTSHFAPFGLVAVQQPLQTTTVKASSHAKVERRPPCVSFRSI